MSAQRDLPPARKKAGGAIVAFVMSAFIIAMVAFAGGWMLAKRRIVSVLRSPSGTVMAYVMDAPCLDGPCQSLWIRENGTSKRLEILGADSESAGEIAWTPDSGRVAFLINGYQLRVFDARTGANLGAMSLVEPDGTPTSRIARGVTFSNNGASVTYDDCPRDHSGCKAAFRAIKSSQ